MKSNPLFLFFALGQWKEALLLAAEISHAGTGVSKTLIACFPEKLIIEKERPLAFMPWPRRDSLEIIFVDKKGHIS